MSTVTLNEIAARLGIARSTVYEAVKDGRLPVQSIGKRGLRLILSSDADAYCAEYIRAHTCASCGHLRARCGAHGLCDPCATKARRARYALIRSQVRAAARECRRPPEPEPQTQSLRPGCPFGGIRVGATVMGADALRAAVAEGIRSGRDFLLAVTEGSARPTDRLGPWEVAACEVRRLHGIGWQAHLPPFGPSWHPQAREVAAWVASILPERETHP